MTEVTAPPVSTKRLDVLPPVTKATQRQLVNGPRTETLHRTLMAQTPAMNAVQTGGAAAATQLPATFNVAAWNVERCLFPDATAAQLAQLSPDIVLLSEVDHGMARTGQRHTTEEIAAALGMTYLFGVEFFEMGLGGPTERAFCHDDHNELGFHGNAILSTVPFLDTALIRLDDHGHWYVGDKGATDPEQPRLGGRMALAAIVPGPTGDLCVVSTHLESNAGADHRHGQFARLLDAVDAFAAGLPVVIGGDLNTGNHLPPEFDWSQETLFALAEDRGYSWEFTGPGMTTRPSLITPHPDRVMKLDWIAGRGVSADAHGILSSVSSQGTPLSDHDCVWSRIQVPRKVTES